MRLLDTVYYFGCWDRAGHAFHAPGNRFLGRDEEKALPFTAAQLDTLMCPKPERVGAAALHHVRGWTVLAWWDRSVDTRPGSNSAIFTCGEHDFGSMLRLLNDRFPTVAARQLVPITLVGV